MCGNAISAVVISAVLLVWSSAACAAEVKCTPTRPDSQGPFYQPEAPLRASVGSGFELTGSVKSAMTCAPIPGARIEVWLAGPDGRYDDAHRATLFADPTGAYRFQSSFPPEYGSRPPHIHVRVTAKGYATLVTQVYPEKGAENGIFDLVLRPE
jgi:protocatechuate 3,4-dioxygenase beta subunit